MRREPGMGSFLHALLSRLPTVEAEAETSQQEAVAKRGRPPPPRGSWSRRLRRHHRQLRQDNHTEPGGGDSAKGRSCNTARLGFQADWATCSGKWVQRRGSAFARSERGPRILVGAASAAEPADRHGDDDWRRPLHRIPDSRGYGSRERKLVECLPPKGTAILNADDRVRGMAECTRARVMTYGVSGHADLRGSEISSRCQTASHSRPRMRRRLRG